MVLFDDKVCYIPALGIQSTNNHDFKHFWLEITRGRNIEQENVFPEERQERQYR